MPAALVKIARGRERTLCVMRERGRYLQRDPAVDTVGSGEDGLEQIGRSGQICQRQFEEQIFRRRRPRGFARNVGVIVVSCS